VQAHPGAVHAAQEAALRIAGLGHPVGVLDDRAGRAVDQGSPVGGGQSQPRAVFKRLVA
jgi:hypothetical protein